MISTYIVSYLILIIFILIIKNRNINNQMKYWRALAKEKDTEIWRLRITKK
jgi:hypothetical protein